ncbi:MAG: thiolase C-terminal domain-containing protein [Alphaproteobacteria bacterium]|jgi:acetyl-CoA acetyltransferase
MTLSSVSDVDASTGKHLAGKYAIAGIGETAYLRGSNRTTRSMATEAISKAMADAGMNADDVDGMLSYSSGDSTFSPFIAGDLGIRLNFYMDVFGGGSSTEALIGIAMGVIEAGMCKTVAIFRSMNGFSQVRIGGTGARSAVPVKGDEMHSRAYGWQAAGQMFAPTFMRHMYDYGTTPEQVAMVKVTHSQHASRNPKAYYKTPVTVDDVLSSRFIVKPLHLLDCCVETDNANCLIITRAERARDHVDRPQALIQSIVGRCCKPRIDMHYQHGPISTVAGHYAKDILWPNAGLGPEDVDVTGAYDAFTFTSMLQLEDYGFCKKGEGGDYVSNGSIRLGGKRPNNTAGGHLCEGYTHGINMVIENVRQLRGEVDDTCPIGPDGKRIHTHDYSETGTCRAVKDVNVTANLGWAMPGTGSAMVMIKG